QVILFVSVQALHDDIGPEAIHGNRSLPLADQLLVQGIQRALVGNQERKTVGKAERVVGGKVWNLFMMLAAPCIDVISARQAFGQGMYAQEATRGAHEFAQP